ncbi:hypothetical protein [Comamonas sp. 26]|nr:hypothetical protein [Comamonas sp. 26]
MDMNYLARMEWKQQNAHGQAMHKQTSIVRALTAAIPSLHLALHRSMA